MSLSLRAVPGSSVLFALVLAAACGGYSSGTGSGNNVAPPAPTAGDINIVEGASTLTTTAFSPNPKTLSLGSASSVDVRWVNGDISGGSGNYMYGTAVVHEIESDNAAFTTSPNLGGNRTYTISLTAGTYNYHCSIHLGMVGTIQVNP